MLINVRDVEIEPTEIRLIFHSRLNKNDKNDKINFNLET